jgi:alkanesulfonate monooxygenase SsuD/methylene tetrahydromethanopterin reductase-like flavin-dependent oxidoreductase (luciferase family)
MRFAMNLPPVGPPRRLVDLAVAAEHGGWDGVFLWDHLHLVRDLALDVVDPWVTLGAIAAATERIRIGPLVTPLPRRRPWKAAKELATLDHLSGGRAVFGAGLGFPPEDEFAMFGEPADGPTRAQLLDEGLALVDAFARGEPVRHDGAHYHVDAHLRPGTLQQPRPPIWIAAMDPFRAPLRRAVRFDGVVPIAGHGGPLTPAGLSAYLEGFARPDGYDVVVGRDADHGADEYADAGATWLIESRWPEGAWFDELLRAAQDGPPE